MDRVHGVVHGPGPCGGPWTPSMFCIRRPLNNSCKTKKKLHRLLHRGKPEIGFTAITIKVVVRRACVRLLFVFWGLIAVRRGDVLRMFTPLLSLLFLQFSKLRKSTTEVYAQKKFPEDIFFFYSEICYRYDIGPRVVQFRE